VTVAFSGGSPELRARIEGAANEWTEYCNLKFDFRQHGKFQEWSASDQKYKAEIRIAFDRKGYWSALGDESARGEPYLPNQPSMNSEGFPTSPPNDLPTLVQHEFGHAIGFQHEHQHPQERSVAWICSSVQKISCPSFGRNTVRNAIPSRTKP
jgi:hypothetical protein